MLHSPSIADTLSTTADTLLGRQTTAAAEIITMPADSAWPGSYIAINEISGDLHISTLSFVDNVANLAIVAAIILLFLFGFNRIAEGIFTLAESVFSFKKMIKIEQETNLQVSRNTLLLFCLVIAAFIFANYNDSHPILSNSYSVGVNFIFALSAASVYLLFRYIAFSLLNYTNRRRFFKYINRFYYSHAIMAITLSVLGFCVSIIFSGIPFRHIALYIIWVTSISLVIYFIRGYQIIISNGFSHFFWILYLCTLEILPLVIILHLILS